MLRMYFYGNVLNIPFKSSLNPVDSTSVGESTESRFDPVQKLRKCSVDGIKVALNPD